jgi:hypothetical protein
VRACVCVCSLFNDSKTNKLDKKEHVVLRIHCHCFCWILNGIRIEVSKKNVKFSTRTNVSLKNDVEQIQLWTIRIEMIIETWKSIYWWTIIDWKWKFELVRRKANTLALFRWIFHRICSCARPSSSKASLTIRSYSFHFFFFRQIHFRLFVTDWKCYVHRDRR